MDRPGLQGEFYLSSSARARDGADIAQEKFGEFSLM